MGRDEILTAPNVTECSAGLCLVTQSCPTLCNTTDPHPTHPGSSVHGILQAGVLEWVVCPPPGDLPNSGIQPRSPALQVDSLVPEPPGKKPLTNYRNNLNAHQQMNG